MSVYLMKISFQTPKFVFFCSPYVDFLFTLCKFPFKPKSCCCSFNVKHKVSATMMGRHKAPRVYESIFRSRNSVLLKLLLCRDQKLKDYIYTTKIIESLCMSGYAFLHASRYRAETWHGGRGWAHEVYGHIFEATPPGVKGHPEVNLP